MTAFFVLLFLIFGPLLVVWALNTLFLLGIPFTLSTWFATLVLLSTVTVRFSRDDK